MKNYLPGLLQTAFIAMLLFSCSDKLSITLTDAEETAARGDIDKALEIYSELLSDTADTDKLDELCSGCDSMVSKAFERIAVSLEKTLPDETERFNFLAEFIRTNKFGFFHYETENLLDYLTEMENIPDELMIDFLDSYIDILDKEGKEYITGSVARVIASTMIAPVDMVNLIAKLNKGIDYEKEIQREGFPTNLYADENPLNKVFGELIDAHLFSRTLKSAAAAFRTNEIFPDLSRYNISSNENYEKGKILPVYLLEEADEFTSIEYDVPEWYYYLNKEIRPSNPSEVDQIVFIKYMLVNNGEYVTSSGKVMGEAKMYLVGLYIYDIEREELVDIQCFFGGEPPESILASEDSTRYDNTKFGESPFPDAFKYLTDEDDLVYEPVAADMETALLILEAASE